MRYEQLKVMIVDDLESARREFVSVLREFVSDAQIDEASDVMEAMEFLRRETPPYDVVFTDVNMPTVSGIKLIPMMRNLDAYKYTPVIVISTLTGRSDIAKALQLGATAYLTRPLQKEYFEIVYLGYLHPILRRK